MEHYANLGRAGDPAAGGTRDDNSMSEDCDISVPYLPVENYPSFASSIQDPELVRFQESSETDATENCNFDATQQQQATGMMVPPASRLAAGGATIAAPTWPPLPQQQQQQPQIPVLPQFDNPNDQRKERPIRKKNTKVAAASKKTAATKASTKTRTTKAPTKTETTKAPTIVLALSPPRGGGTPLPTEEAAAALPPPPPEQNMPALPKNIIKDNTASKETAAKKAGTKTVATNASTIVLALSPPRGGGTSLPAEAAAAAALPLPPPPPEQKMPASPKDIIKDNTEAAAPRPPQQKSPALLKNNSTQEKRKASDRQESSSTSTPVSKKSKTATPADEQRSHYTKKDGDPYLVRYPKLVKFKQENGHLNVNYDEMPGLHVFILDCKKEYASIQEGNASDMLTPLRIAQLNELEFPWSNGPGAIKLDPEWDERFAELVEFQKEHGHCRVTMNQNETLARFVHNTRTNYRYFMISSKSKILTPERLQKLRSIGFEFPDETKSKIRNDVRSWDECFMKLQAFKKSHGHTVVPSSFDQDLKKWVRLQKRYYILYMDMIRVDNERKLAAWEDPEGKVPDELEKEYKELRKPRSITADQILRLHLIGFDSAVLKTPPRVRKASRQTPEEAWDNQYKALIEFKEKHGHTRVSRNYQENLRLGKWVNHQRFYMGLKRRGDPKGAPLTDERIRRLDEIGFEWRLKPIVTDFGGGSSDDDYSEDDDFE